MATQNIFSTTSYNLVSDPGGVAAPGPYPSFPVNQSANISMNIAAGVAEVTTLASPTYLNQVLFLSAAVVGAGGTRAVTLTGAGNTLNVAGNTVITFNATNDSVGLIAVQVGTALRWRVLFNSDVTLS
jgi:hypothetical protein